MAAGRERARVAAVLPRTARFRDRRVTAASAASAPPQSSTGRSPGLRGPFPRARLPGASVSPGRMQEGAGRWEERRQLAGRVRRPWPPSREGREGGAPGPQLQEPQAVFPIRVLPYGLSLDSPAGSWGEVVGSLWTLKGNTGLRCERPLKGWSDPRGPGPGAGSQHLGFLLQDRVFGHTRFSPAVGRRLERQASGSHCERKASRYCSPLSASGLRWTGRHP